VSETAGGSTRKGCSESNEEARGSGGGRTVGDGEDGGPLAPCLQSFECAVSASLGLHEARGWLDPGAGVRAGGAPFCHLEMPPSLGACRGGTIPSDATVMCGWRGAGRCLPHRTQLSEPILEKATLPTKRKCCIAST